MYERDYVCTCQKICSYTFIMWLICNYVLKSGQSEYEKEFWTCIRGCLCLWLLVQSSVIMRVYSFRVQGVRWGGCNALGLWAVPEMVGDVGNSEMRVKDGEEIRSTTLKQREASVLRYKEKRQNRLFSRKIRYQVRKLNADKRPRLKVHTPFFSTMVQNSY